MITAALNFEDLRSAATIQAMASCEAIRQIFVAGKAEALSGLGAAAQNKIELFEVDWLSGRGINLLLDSAKTDYLLLALPGGQIDFCGSADTAIGRLLEVAEDTRAALLYSDFKEDVAGRLLDHPLADYQLGSIRDEFDFGSLVLISKRSAKRALRDHGPIDNQLRWGGFYDLRLKLSIDSTILRLPEPLYARSLSEARLGPGRLFDYVDPKRRDYQIEMERIATAHLKRIGAYLPPEFEPLPPAESEFPVRASVIIPVRNRQSTIADAILSALSQKTSFDFNVIVVDNHSTDRTTQIVKDLAARHSNLIHLVPRRKDLGIGGCWNEATSSPHCGLIAAQLDSDDLYSDEFALEKLVSKFDQGPYAMVVGSYTVVNFDLKEVPPGLVDHREWTRENGRNNALRVNGFGAPRAFYVPALRRFTFPNVSYGEDYAAGLRISRHYEIGRIYESIYLARRWEDNSDARLDATTASRYDQYKDRLRTIEILARKRINQKCGRREYSPS